MSHVDGSVSQLTCHNSHSGLFKGLQRSVCGECFFNTISARYHRPDVNRFNIADFIVSVEFCINVLAA